MSFTLARVIHWNGLRGILLTVYGDYVYFHLTGVDKVDRKGITEGVGVIIEGSRIQIATSSFSRWRNNE